MRIVLDFRCVFKGMGGIGRYAWCLLHALARIDRANEYVCYFTHLEPPGPLRLPPNFHRRSFEAGMIDERFDQLLLPTLLAGDRADLYHNATFAVPSVRTRARTVATVHDVVFKRHPELVEPRLRRYLDAATRRACRSADRIVTVSHHSKEELVGLYAVDADRVSVIHNGIEPPPPRTGSPEADLARTGLTAQSYVLYVGSIEPKKNIDALLLAFREAALRLKPAPPLKLVLAGSRAPAAYPLESRISELGLADRVVVPGYVPADVLESLYGGALVFVYPSLYEGFGFPPLEAMARGVPAIVSNASSLPEVVGEDALLFDPQRPAELADLLVGLAGDASWRGELSRRGRERAAQYTWRRSAEEHLEAYEAAMRVHEDSPSRV